MSESFREQLSRVEMMAEGSDTWDLSDNDTAALRAVLEHVAALERNLAAERERREAAERELQVLSFASSNVALHNGFPVEAQKVITYQAMRLERSEAEAARRAFLEALAAR